MKKIIILIILLYSCESKPRHYTNKVISDIHRNNVGYTIYWEDDGKHTGDFYVTTDGVYCKIGDTLPESKLRK